MLLVPISSGTSKTITFNCNWGYGFLVAQTSASTTLSAVGVLWYVFGWVSASRGKAISLGETSTQITIDMTSTSKQFTIANNTNGDVIFQIIDLSGDASFAIVDT